ncbi:MAG TPA: oxidoreductase [Longimicrobiaceae bacterium]|nr:oxidoreductase [Longimicrobiaceae bacterium]
MSHRTALLLGATGLVGGHCLNFLLNDEAYGTVSVLGRRPLAREHPKLEQHVVDFDHLEGFADLIRAHDVFCCLGTTIRKAGSQEAFRRVDFEYPYQSARIAARQGAERFLIVTAIGADPGSRIFYNRVKGEVEEAVKALSFGSVVILRPSLLLGEREELRLGERLAEPVMRVVSPLMLGPLRRYRPVPSRKVAAAMVRLAKEEGQGVRIVESDEIVRIAS